MAMLLLNKIDNATECRFRQSSVKIIGYPSAIIILRGCGIYKIGNPKFEYIVKNHYFVASFNF